MKKIKIIFICCLILLIPNKIYAHPGRLDGKGCHTCKTNCSSWGLNHNEYHCHNGSTYSNSKGQIYNKDGSLKSNPSNNNSSNKNQSTNSNTNSNTNTSKPPVYKKSSDTNLSFIKVDGENIPIDTEMNFNTTNDNPKVEAKPSHNKATLNINRPNSFSKDKQNEVTIVVKAEDNSLKEYKLYINLVSNDATIKSLKINNEEINVSDEMFYETSESKIKLLTKTSDEKAQVTSNQEYDLAIGENKITINILASDGVTKKEYLLNIKRKEDLSSNINIKVTVNGEEAKFKDYKSETIYLSHDIDNLDIDYKLEDEKAKIELIDDKKIDIGKKTIKFKVIAENGFEQEYLLNLYKYNQAEETIYGLIGLSVLGGSGFLAIKYFKKIKNKK